jgi:periplasmic divalent cation tolerance protein
MEPHGDRFQIVLTTAGSDEQARSIARGLVERRLAACVNIVPLGCSVYRWKGRIEEEEEWLLVIKTAERLFPAVSAAVRELHTYETPEVLALDVRDGDPDYLRWLGDSLVERSGGATVRTRTRR